MHTAVQATMEDNQQLMFDLHQFKIFVKDLIQTNKSLQEQISLHQLVKDQLDHLTNLNLKLKAENTFYREQNQKINERYQMTIEVIQEQCTRDQRAEEDDLIEQLWTENEALRAMVNINVDTQSLHRIEDLIREEENVLNEAESKANLSDSTAI